MKQAAIRTKGISIRNGSLRKKPISSIVGLILLLVLVAGGVAAVLLSGKSADLRQQADGSALCTGNTASWETDCDVAGGSHCIATTHICEPAGTIISDSVVLGNTDDPSELQGSQMIYWSSLLNPCPSAVDVTQAPGSPYNFRVVVTAMSPSTWHRCGSTTCSCVYGAQSGSTGPTICTHPNGSTYSVPLGGGCAASGSGGSASPLPTPTGTTSGGGGGGGGSIPTPLPGASTRSISGKILCEKTLPNIPAFSQPYGIRNASVRLFQGTSSGMGPMIAETTTDTQGNYQFTNFNLVNDARFTIRPTKGTEGTESDMAFTRSGNPGVTCIDTYGYELCNAMAIPMGSIRPGFDFKTTAQASNLRGYMSASGFIFEFTQARNINNTLIDRYVVRLDNIETPTSVWEPGNFNRSDYWLVVPGALGSCSGGKCRISHAELQRSKAFRSGNYTFGVNPIANSSQSGEPVVELCRNSATVRAIIPTGDTQRK